MRRVVAFGERVFFFMEVPRGCEGAIIVPGMEFQIIRCTPDAHAAAVQTILNDAIVNTTALYDYEPRSLSTVVQWFGAKARRGDPVLGAIDATGVLLGFASYGPFRQWPALQIHRGALGLRGAGTTPARRGGRR